MSETSKSSGSYARFVAGIPMMRLHTRGERCGISHGFTDVSPRLTSLGPQLPHRPVDLERFPWSERFEHIFRNEGVTGSNPVSSTKHPGQGDF